MNYPEAILFQAAATTYLILGQNILWSRIIMFVLPATHKEMRFQNIPFPCEDAPRGLSWVSIIRYNMIKLDFFDYFWPTKYPSAPQNDYLNFSSVKDIDVVGKQWLEVVLNRIFRPIANFRKHPLIVFP